jgi:hypothetical protein
MPPQAQREEEDKVLCNFIVFYMNSFLFNIQKQCVRAGGVAQVVEHLAGIRLSSNPSTIRKKI